MVLISTKNKWINGDIYPILKISEMSFLRSFLRLSFFWEIGNGFMVSLWHDYWLSCGPLDSFVPTSLMECIDLPSDAVVADLFSLVGRRLKVFLETWDIPIPNPSSTLDRFSWRNDTTGMF